jgi:hypothetical protein
MDFIERSRQHDVPPASGEAAPGSPLDPESLPDDEPVSDSKQSKPRAAPAPQSPLPDEEIERLKSKAAGSAPPSTVPGHADPASKKRRR